ncbi:MAG: hypothetical protein DWH81_01135 [Planctomycetota bacterium]|nr:MAG: hypothetical protein DWH81_01135 [Planctomycetota bacterium]
MSNAPSPDKPTRGVILVSYPKVVFLYPSVIIAIIAGLYMQVAGNKAMDGTRHSPAAVTAPADGAAAQPAVNDTKSFAVGPTMAAGAFLLTLALNLVITSFDFPRTTSVTLAALAAALFLGTMLLITYKPDLVPFATNLVKKLHPQANATFYYCYVIAMGLIYIGVFVNSKFDYWEVRQNEMLHHHGFLSDLERFPTSSLKIDKEIKDIFEYMLLKSGRMILNPGPQQRPIILENVFFIDQKESQITKLLSSMQVQIAPPSEQV